MNKELAKRIADAMNHWPGKQNPCKVITAEQAAMLQPIHKADGPDGYTVYAVQWGDVTIVVWVRSSGEVYVKNLCW